MKGSYLVLLGLLLVGFFAHAEVQTEKLLDGLAVYCNAQATPVPGNKAIKVELVSEKSTEENNEATLKVSVVKCEDSKWVADHLPNSESYVAPNGLKVNVTYSNYELIFVNSRYEVILRTSLEQLNTGVDQQDYSMSVAKANEDTHELEVFVQATKTVKVENGYQYSEPTRFGGFRIRVK
ncbi:hypothetical protein [Bdellovibrio sp. BCCA]|uniref:hypothetical protein n=1 Tax=Bdellovibrio sp. BCCA TaxID=3136281 RepID=UPI0030F007DC